MPGPNDPPGGAPQHGDAVLERTRQETKEPPLYKVILLNDDYTTMEFVVLVLEQVFHKSPAEAFRIMMQVHTQGKGLCGLYPLRHRRDEGRDGHELRARARIPAAARAWKQE